MLRHAIVNHLNRHNIRTRDGGRWGIGQLHRILTRKTYIGEHEFNRRSMKKEIKPESEVVTVAVPAIIDRETFEAVQNHLRSRNPKVSPPRVVSGPALLTGICFCDKCGGAMTLRTGKYGQYRYYTCSTKAHQGEMGCTGMTMPMDKIDTLITDHLERHILQPERLEMILHTVLDRRQEHTGERLYDAIETGVADLDDPDLKERIHQLKALRDAARVESARITAMLDSSQKKAITPQMLEHFAKAARKRLREPSSGYRREHLRALAQRVEVGNGRVRIIGHKGNLLRALAGLSGEKTLQKQVPTFVPEWRRRSPLFVCFRGFLTVSSRFN